MKSILFHALVATLATAATSIAGAQQFGPLPPSAEAAGVEAPAAGPVASISRPDVPNGELGDKIVQAINADSSMAGSKVTVAPDSDGVTLVGVTKTKVQAKKAGELATGIAGALRITNAIQAEES